MNSVTTFNKVNWKDWKTYTLLLPVLVVFLLWKPLEALRKRVWSDKDWSGGFVHEVLAIGAGWGAAVTAAANHSLPLFSWLGSIGEGIVGGFLTWAYIFPIVWLLGLRPAYRVIKWCYNHLEWVDKNVLGPLLQLTSKLFGWLPFAASGWAQMKDDNWFVELVGGIAYLTAVGGSLGVGWIAKTWLENSVHLPGFISHEFILGGAWAVGILVAGLLSRLLVGAVQEGNKQGVGAVVAAASTYAAWHFGGLAAAAAFTGIPALALGAVSYILLAVYAFPLFYVIFASGFWKHLWKTVEPAYERFGSGAETPFRHLHLQGLGILVSLAITGASCLLCGALGVNLLVAFAVPLLTLLVVYAFIPALLDEDYGNIAVGVIVSLGLAIWAGISYAHAGYIFGVWGAAATGVISGIASGLIIPLLYCGTEWLVTLPGIKLLTNWVGNGLPKVHNGYIDHIAEPFVDKCEAVYNWGYGRKEKDEKKAARVASFSRLTLHGANGIIAAALSVAAYVGLQQITLLAGFEPVVGYVASAIVAIFSVGLIGRVIYRAGLELCGGIVAVLVALWVGMHVLPAQQFGVWFAVPYALLVGALTFWVGFPALVIPLRALTSWAAPWVNVPLDWLNNKAWWLTKGFATTFGHVFEFIYDLFEPVWRFFGRCIMWLVRFTAPFWMAIAGAFAGGWAIARNIWKSIFG